MYALGCVRKLEPIMRLGPFKSPRELKTVNQLNFHPSAWNHMQGRTRCDAVVHPEDGIEGGTLIIDEVIRQCDPGDTIPIRLDLKRLAERLERLRQIEGRVGIIGVAFDCFPSFSSLTDSSRSILTGVSRSILTSFSSLSGLGGTGVRQLLSHH